jgi:quinoprotein glucose dehydrogenase
LQAARTAAGLQAPQLDETLAKLADQADAPAELRLEALRAIALRRPTLPPATAGFVVAALADEERPLARLVAAEIIGRANLTDEQLRQALPTLRGSAVISPSVVLASLLRASTAESAGLVAEYLAEAIRKGWRPSEQELTQTLKQLAPAGAKASALAESARQIGEQHRQRLAENEPLLRGGDPARGRAVFFGGKTACATCHRIGSDGGTIGPDLTKVGLIRAGRDILESVLVPSSTIAQGYDPYVVVTAEGKTLHGIIARQTAELVVLRDASGAELHLRQDRIQEMRRATTSIMPEGLERALSRDELRDLLAFLQGLR